MSKWIKKGDNVLVIAGNEKGKRGAVVARLDDRVVIQGVNLRKKHVKRDKKAPGAGIIDIECPIHISNVCLCDSEGVRVKLKHRKKETGCSELYYLREGQEVVLREV